MGFNGPVAGGLFATSGHPYYQQIGSGNANMGIFFFDGDPKKEVVR